MNLLCAVKKIGTNAYAKERYGINMDELQANKYFLFRNTENLPNLGADAHYHSYFEIYCLTGGGADSFVDNKLYNLQLGDVVVIPPGAIHGTHYSTERHGRILVNFTFHYIPKSLVEPLSGQAFLYRCEETREDVARIFEKIGKEYEAPDGFSEEAIRSLLAQLVIMVVRHVRGDAPAAPANSFIETVVNYVQNNYRNSFSLEDVARECRISKVHLSRNFKKKTGIGLSQYISIYRMKKAKELLLVQNKMSICDVAYDCGFNDSNYFSWLFKKTYGVTPLQYRKNTKG